MKVQRQLGELGLVRLTRPLMAEALAAKVRSETFETLGRPTRVEPRSSRRPTLTSIATREVTAIAQSLA
jgi:hypothetical protein